MIKNHNTRKLAVTPSHKRAMMRNMTRDLFLHEKITTTVPRAKEVVRFAEKLITKAKRNIVIPDSEAEKKLHNKREVFRVIKNRDIVKKLFEDIAPRFKDKRRLHKDVSSRI